MDTVEFLIKNGADLSTIHLTDSTLFDLAHSEGMVNLLISNGAKLNVAENEDGLTLLHLATRAGELLITISCRTSEYRKTSSFFTYLFGTFMVSGNGAVCELLIQNGSDINARDKGNQTPLDYAIKQGWLRFKRAICSAFHNYKIYFSNLRFRKQKCD